MAAFCLTGFFFGLVPASARGDTGDLLATYNFEGSKFALHPTQSLLYASLPSLNSVAVINTDTLALVDTVFVGSSPRGIAVSPDGSRLYVANAGSSFLGVLNTASHALLPSIALPTNPGMVAAGNGGRVYATPASSSGSYGIMQVDANAGNYVGEFDFGVSIAANGLVEMSPDRGTLYFGNQGSSPATLAKYDVSTSTASLILRNPHGSLGSNGQDVAVSHDGTFVSYAVGSGNGAGYSIFKLRSEDFLSLGEFNTGAYPSEITFSPDDAIAYSVHTSGAIDLFNTTTFLSEGTIPVQGEASELITDRFGKHLFAIFDDQLRVYDTGRVVPEPGAMMLLGIGACAALSRNRRRS